MRRLSRTGTASKDERGVVAPMTAMLMTALLGMAALAVDTAMIYSEHAQLQNGADAAALAIAQQCSKAPTPCASGQGAAAAGYANGNALDNRSNVLNATADATARTVEVTTQSQMADGTNHFSLQFAKALGISSADLRATATASWGYPSKNAGFPLALSQECWKLGPAASATMTLQKIMWRPGTTCTNDAGHTVPGGWGWLNDTSAAPCEATTTVGNYASSNPGNNPPKMCKDILKVWVDTLTAGGTINVLFPVFDTASGSGNTGVFHIVGYATFRIFGWNFGDAKGSYKFRNTATDPYMNDKLACAHIDDRCLIGAFVKFETSGGGGGGLNFGTSSVSLIK